MKILNLFSAVTFLLITLFSVFYFSCSKQRTETQLNSYSPVNSYLNSKEQPEQTFTIDSNGTCPIVGRDSTKIWPSKRCLVYPNGDSVHFPFTIKLVELYTAKDMIYYQMPTVSVGTILKTDGEIRLRAFKGTTELALRPSPCGYQIEMPCAAPQSNMDAFYGTTTNNHPDWMNTPLTPFTTNTASYTAFVQILGWINCGQLAGSSSNSTLTFTSTTDDLTNVGIFIYIPATKTVMQAYNSTTTSIPNGSAVKIVAIGVNASENLFSFYQTQTVNSNSTVSITLSATT